MIVGHFVISVILFYKIMLSLFKKISKYST